MMWRRAVILSALAFGSVVYAVPRRAAASHTGDVQISVLAPRYYLLSSPSGNLLLYTDDTLSLVAGVQAPALVVATHRLIDSLHAPRVRYALILESDSAPVYADAHWGSLGALTIADENLCPTIQRTIDSLRRDGHLAYGAAPAIGFSGVMQIYMEHEQPHFAHRPPGLTLRDVLIHFERANIVMLGNLMTTDEYPLFQEPRRHRVTNLIGSLSWFADTLPVKTIIPGRGRPVTMEGLRAYRDMLVTVVARIEKLRAAGQSDDEIAHALPTREFDARWGHSGVSGEAFVRSLTRALARN